MPRALLTRFAGAALAIGVSCASARGETRAAGQGWGWAFPAQSAEPIQAPTSGGGRWGEIGPPPEAPVAPPHGQPEWGDAPDLPQMEEEARFSPLNPLLAPNVEPRDAEPTQLRSSAARLARARAYLGLGRHRAARDELAAVLREDPNNAQALRLLAAADEQDERWADAAQNLERAYALTGDAASLERAQSLQRATRPALSIAGFYFGSDNDQQSGARADAVVYVGAGSKLEAAIEGRRAEQQLEETNSETTSDVIRLDIGYRSPMMGAVFAGELNVTEAAIGGALLARAGRRTGFVETSLGLRQPYWLSADGVFSEAVQSHIGFGAGVARGPIAFRGDLRYVRYGVNGGDDEAADAARGVFGVDIANFKDETSPRISYVLDAESIEKRTLFVNEGGMTFEPLILRDRQVHSLGVYKLFVPMKPWRLDVGLGYRVDIEGEEGPFAGLTTSFALSELIELGALVEYSEPSTRGLAEESDYVFSRVYLRRRY